MKELLLGTASMILFLITTLLVAVGLDALFQSYWVLVESLFLVGAYHIVNGEFAIECKKEN